MTMQYETKKRSGLLSRATSALAIVMALTMLPQAAAETTSPTPEPQATQSLAPEADETQAPTTPEPEATDVPEAPAEEAPGEVEPATPAPAQTESTEAPAVVEATQEAPIAELESAASPGPVAVYRFWSPKHGSHFFTADVNERNAVAENWPGVWAYEKVAFGAYTEQVPGTQPVYRFWSEVYKTHFYTISETEKNTILERWPNDWKLEGVAYWAYPASEEASWLHTVERYWSVMHGSHFFTIDAADKQAISQRWSNIWAAEGARFKVVSGPVAAPWPAPKLNERDQWKADAGIARADWGYVDYIVQRESGWNPNAVNPSSGACGLVQIMPLHTEAYRTCKDPVANLRWADNYAKGRYGSWSGAYNFWLSNHWW